jgi:energy-coupling factor transporter transmembrane protein EcfT
VVGILGFIPGVTRGEHLLGIFHVNSAHNAVHILTGLVALIAGGVSGYAAKMFFRVFGVIYGLVAILGFMNGNAPIFGLISNNSADTWLHAGIAVASLAIGFGLKEPAVSKTHLRAA